MLRGEAGNSFGGSGTGDTLTVESRSTSTTKTRRTRSGDFLMANGQPVQANPGERTIRSARASAVSMIILDG
jgi:hypothetical protein